jgi:hypothetical protein
LTREAEARGADATLSIVPYYNRPTQAGLLAHFKAIAQSTGLPIILYDVPCRTACSLADETIVRLAESPQFMGLKDATGDIIRPARLRSLVGNRLLSGDDATALAFFVQGNPAGQYDVALVDWRRRTFNALETTLDWLVDFLSPAGVVVWVDPLKLAARQDLRSALERRGFVIEAGTVHHYGSAVSARRREMNPMPKAA